MKRRGFLGLLSSIPFAPLVAKDMGDIDFDRDLSDLFFEPRPVEPPIVPITRVINPPTPWAGQLRNNTDTAKMEIFTDKWMEIT